MELPLFPLHLVLFPGRPLPLHLFEPRYRQMLTDCLDGDRRFGVVAIRSGREVASPAAAPQDHQVEIFDVGTVAEIRKVVERPDGRFDIATRGCQRFRVHERVPGTPYLRARVELLPDDPAAEQDLEYAQQVRDLLLPYLADLGAPPELLARIPENAAELTWLAAAALHVEVPEQQRLLEECSTARRLATTLRMLRREAGIMRHFGTVGSLRPAGPGGAQLN